VCSATRLSSCVANLSCFATPALIRIHASLGTFQGGNDTGTVRQLSINKLQYILNVDHLSFQELTCLLLQLNSSLFSYFRQRVIHVIFLRCNIGKGRDSSFFAVNVHYMWPTGL
jgi:hypothetical protein